MKIIKQLREIHQEAKEKFDRLAREVQDTLKPRVEEKRWFFLSRVKQLESFALKVETGRVPEPVNMEDFFACTIVVPTINQIAAAEELVKSLYEFAYRRPTNDGSTYKQAYCFPFDDLRLYMRRKPVLSGRDEDLNGLLFEVQIKTSLQYAWGVATHDLIYKTNTVNWALERIAFQVKAMLEHAEVVIAEANSLSSSYILAKTDEKTDTILQIIDHVKTIWPPDQLPEDVKRLAETINDLLRICDLTPDGLNTIFENEKLRVGLLPTNLSPYAFTVQALANSSTVNFEEKFTKRRGKLSLVIHTGMDLPQWLIASQKGIINLG